MPREEGAHEHGISRKLKAILRLQCTGVKDEIDCEVMIRSL